MKKYTNLFKKSPQLKRNTYESKHSEDSTFIKKMSFYVKEKQESIQSARFANKQTKNNRAIALDLHSYHQKVFGVATISAIPFLFLFSSMSSFAIPVDVIEIAPVSVEAGVIQTMNVSTMALPAGEIIRDGYTVVTRPKISFAGMQTAATFINDIHSEIQWPFGEGVPITSDFGPRTPICFDGENCTKPFHNGIDFTPGEGTPIQAITEGVVTNVSPNNGGYGHHVTIDHQIDGATVTSLYAHMIDGSSPMVVGQKVYTGDLVGNVGSTGQSTGAHLHFELLVNGESINPMTWDKWGQELK